MLPHIIKCDGTRVKFSDRDGKPTSFQSVREVVGGKYDLSNVNTMEFDRQVSPADFKKLYARLGSVFRR